MEAQYSLKRRLIDHLNDGVLVVQKFSDFVVVGPNHALHRNFARGVSLHCDATVYDQNAARELGCESRFKEMQLEIRKLRLIHENGRMTCRVGKRCDEESSAGENSGAR